MASEIIEHLLAGGKVILSADKEGELEPFVWTLDWVALASGTATAQVTTKTLEKDYEIFKTKDELEIERLKAIIDRQNEEIQNLVKPKRTNPRKPRRVLSNPEKQEIYKHFERGILNDTEIAKEFDSSRSAISRLHREWEKKIKPLQQAS